MELFNEIWEWNLVLGHRIQVENLDIDLGRDGIQVLNLCMEFRYGTWAWILGMEIGYGIQVWNFSMELRNGIQAWSLGIDFWYETWYKLQVWNLSMEFRYGT